MDMVLLAMVDERVGTEKDWNGEDLRSVVANLELQ